MPTIRSSPHSSSSSLSAAALLRTPLLLLLAGALMWLVVPAFVSSFPTTGTNLVYRTSPNISSSRVAAIAASAHQQQESPNRISVSQDVNSGKRSAHVLSSTQGDDDSSSENSLIGADVPSQNISPAPLVAASRLLRLLFRGVTMPFPALRSLAETSSNSNSNKQTNKRDEKKIRVGFSFRESVLAIAVYLALGVVSYSSTILQHDQAWSLVDALYFGVVTFTSVGYGDLCPTTTAGKMFTILFGLSGIALLGAAIATIGSRIMEREDQMMQAAQEASRKRVMSLFHSLHNVGGKNETKNNIAADTKAKTATEGNVGQAQTPETRTPRGFLGIVPLWHQTLGHLLKKSVPAIVALMLGGGIMGRIEGWSVTDSVYYAFITAGTLGYGDFSPLTRRGRIWGIVFIPLAVAAAGEILGNVASVLLERRQEQVYENLMKRELDIDQLLEMDTDHDGRVSREEYVQFMLKEMELVPEEQFEELHAQFERLDRDGGGYLDKEDLKVMKEEMKRDERHQ